jgi:hypothetical protein
MLVFNREKYIESRMKKEGLTRETVEMILDYSVYGNFDGVSRDELVEDGYIILKAWCVEDE